MSSLFTIGKQPIAALSCRSPLRLDSTEVVANTAADINTCASNPASGTFIDITNGCRLIDVRETCLLIPRVVVFRVHDPLNLPPTDARWPCLLTVDALSGVLHENQSFR
jgi:hypothetical protein